MSIIMCNQCEFESSCSLKNIASDLTGCIGHGRFHHRYEDERKRLKEEAEEKRKNAQILNTEVLKDIAPGDKVQLIGSTISLGLRLPRYLDNGVFTVIGIARNGKIKCDWDGGKPFYIPALCLKKIKD